MAEPAYACTCMAPATAAEALQKSSAVFRGRVVTIYRSFLDRVGITTDMAPDLAGKRLEILKEAFPKVSRVGHLWERGSSPGAAHFKEVEAAGRALQVRVQALEVPGPNDLLGAFQSARVAGADSLIVVGFGFLNSHRERIVNLATKHRLPAMYTTTPYVVVGGLMSYAPDGSDRMRRAAVYVDKILKGTKPTDLPVQQPMKFEFVVNLKTVTQIGLTMSPNVLARADRVIK